MSATLDTNILLYASNEADPAHEVARTVLERLAMGPDILYLFWPVLMGYIRILTNPRAMSEPWTPAEATANVAGLVARAHVRTPGETEGFWELYRLTAGERTRGNLVPDAHLAALMRQHGVRTIYTRDRDFRRFDGIESLDPFD